jgi:hypothetical protein
MTGVLAVPLDGKYCYLGKRAGEASDPRYVFDKAMLEHHTYEKYLAQVGELKVNAFNSASAM